MNNNKETEIARNRQSVITALLSGRYQQNNGELRNGDKYCVLGVVCDVSRLGEWIPATSGLPVYYYHIPGTNRHALTRLPNDVLRWLGVNDGKLEAFYINGLHEVAWMNDNGASLADIGWGLMQVWDLEPLEEWHEALDRLAQADADDYDDYDYDYYG